MAPPFQLQLQVSDEGLQWLIARGLADDALPASKEPAPSWPPEGPKAGTDGTLKMEIQRDLSNQNGDLTEFIQPKKGTKWDFNGDLMRLQGIWWEFNGDLISPNGDSI